MIGPHNVMTSPMTLLDCVHEDVIWDDVWNLLLSLCGLHDQLIQDPLPDDRFKDPLPDILLLATLYQMTHFSKYPLPDNSPLLRPFTKWSTFSKPFTRWFILLLLTITMTIPVSISCSVWTYVFVCVCVHASSCSCVCICTLLCLCVCMFLHFVDWRHLCRRLWSTLTATTTASPAWTARTEPCWGWATTSTRWRNRRRTRRGSWTSRATWPAGPEMT